MSVAREFLGAPAGPIPSLPYTTETLVLSSERLLDGFVVLGVAVVLFAAGWALREFALPNFRPAVFTLVCIGVLVFLGANPVVWQIEAVTVDYDSITCSYWSGEREQVLFEEVVDIHVEDGMIFPMFLDDTTLVVRDDSGGACAVPAFLPGSAEVAAVIEEVDS